MVMLEVETEELGMLGSDPESVYTTALDYTLDTDLRKDVLTYVSGFVQRSAVTKLSWCPNCLLYFSLDYSDQASSCSLIRQKDHGGLIKPMKEVCELVEVVDWVVLHNSMCINFLSTKTLDTYYPFQV